MKPSAALLIDLENFYLSRIDYLNDENFRSENRPSFAEDLKNLVRYAQKMAGLPFAVRRAYADFDSLNVNHQELMRQGVEPVQVFRLSGKTGNKNAADMKLAMDAVSLLSSGGHIEHFVLVSGDADFIPVILELKRLGHAVSVIAVTGATNEFIQRFVDKFELFENLATASGTERPERRDRVAVLDELPKIAAALRRVLGRSRPLRFNIVQPQLSKELGYTFDPDAYGCESTGEFLRKYYAALGVVYRGTQNEQEIDLPGSPVPSSHGNNGSKTVARQAPRTVPVAAPEPHSAAHYKLLLASGRADANEARVITIPWASLTWVCDAVVPALTPPTGAPATSMELMPRLQAAARATGVPDLASHVALIHSAVRCSLPVPPTPGGVHSLAAETTGELLRRELLRYVVYVLGCRLSENSVAGPIQPDSVAAMFDPGPAAESATAEIVAALARADARAEAEPVAQVATTPVIPKTTTRADDNHVHTPDTYRKLLQNGGPLGSGETEHQRIHIAPWPSVERACTDTFAALSPAGTTLQRGQFLERLYAAEKEMCVDNYRSHMRRAFSLLGLSHAILEEDDRVTLHPEVADASDIRWAVLGTMLQLLAVRLSEKGAAEPIRSDVFVAAIEAGPFTDEMIPEIARAVQSMYQESDGAGAEDKVQLEAVVDHTSALLPLADVEENAIEDLANELARASELQTGPMSGAEPGWDSFDGVLPEYATTAPPVEELEPFPDPIETSASVIDVAALTSAAVAAVIEPAVQVIPVAANSDVFTQSESELVVFAPPLEVNPAPVPPSDGRPLEVPVVEWLVDDDAIFSESEFGGDRITERLTGSSTPFAPLPPAETQVSVARIQSPPSLAVEPSPLPPSPSESA